MSQMISTSTTEDLDLRVAVHYGIPSTASILAFDPIQRLLAIGTFTNEEVEKSHNPRPRDQQALLLPAATDKWAGIRSATSKPVFICLFGVAAVVMVFSESALETSMNSQCVIPKSSSSSLISKKKRKGKKYF
ncbi:hypothetical protein DVH24_036170 [Malus domestica]|uniref:Uncharacterized protein n=1 Tax=Malus domestica TaxID=3750 RepID=A0A498IFM0_MALDO|nr:hypothetical protein DVH24_036170 [Malus domestica]